jgi:hypothetical protein
MSGKIKWSRVGDLNSWGAAPMTRADRMEMAWMWAGLEASRAILSDDPLVWRNCLSLIEQHARHDFPHLTSSAAPETADSDQPRTTLG